MNLPRTLTRTATLVAMAILIGGPTATAHQTQWTAEHEAALQRADQLIDGRRYDEAAEVLKPLVEHTHGQQRAELMLMRGKALQWGKGYAQAAETYEAALQIEPLDTDTRADLHSQLGYVYRLLRQWDKAEPHLLTAAHDDEASHNIRIVAALMAGWGYNKADDPDASIRMLELAASLTEAPPYNRASALVSLGDMHRRAERFDEARAAWERGLELEGTGKKAITLKTRLEELAEQTAPDGPFYIEPFVTRVGPGHAWVHWIAKGDAFPVDITITPQGDDHPVEVRQLDEAIPDHPFTLQRAELTGLRAGQTYRYTLTHEDDSVSGSFVAYQADATEPFTFVMMGDTQTQAHVHTELAPHIAKIHPDFAVMCGDFVERGNNWYEWKSQAFAPGYPYLEKTVFWPVRGNHDGGPYFPQLFGLDNGQFFTFRQKNVRVYVLDSFGPDAGSRGRSKQAAWLEEQLEQDEPGVDWRIVAVHDPMVKSDTVVPWWGKDELLPILEKHHVDMVFSGHQHRYRRFYPIGSHGGRGILHITTGGAGGTLGGHHHSPIMPKVAFVHHFIAADVDGQRITLRVIDIEGNTIESLHLDKTTTPSDWGDPQIGQRVETDVAHAISPLYVHLVLPRTDHQVGITPEHPVEPGQPVTFVIDLAKLPAGALDPATLPDDLRLTIEGTAGCPWTIERQTVDLTSGVLRFDATAPDTLDITEERVHPSPDLLLTTYLGPRKLVPMHAHGVITPHHD